MFALIPSQSTALERAVLHYLALLPTGGTLASLSQLINQFLPNTPKPSHTQLTQALKKWHDTGWIVGAATIQHARLSPQALVAVWADLADYPERLVLGQSELLQKDYRTSYGIADLQALQRSALYLQLFTQTPLDADGQKRLQDHPDWAASLFGQGEHAALLLQSLPEPTQRLVWASAIAYWLNTLSPLPCWPLPEPPALSPAAQDQLGLLQLLCHPSRAPLVEPPVGSAASILLALLRGEFARVVELSQHWLQQYGCPPGKRKPVVPEWLFHCYTAALLCQGDAGYDAFQHWMAEHKKWPEQVVWLGMSQQNGTSGVSLQDEAPRTVLRGWSGFWLALCCHWSERKAGKPAHPKPREDWNLAIMALRNTLRNGHYAFCEQELTGLLQRRTGQTPDLSWHQHGTTQPLTEIYQPAPAWQQALATLTRLYQPAPSSPSASSEYRLAWFVEVTKHQLVTLEPREQKYSAKGQWSKGRAVALRRLIGSEDPPPAYLCAQDRAALSAVHTEQQYYYGGYRYELDVEQALLGLVGHPAVFRTEAPDVRIDLLAGQPALHLAQKGGEIQVSLWPPKLAQADTLLLEQETPTRWRVFAITQDIHQISHIIGRGLSVPLSGKAQLLDAIAHIAPLIPVQSDMAELSQHLESVPANGMLYAHLLPLEAGLRLQLRVQPLAGGNDYPPGAGMMSLVGEQDGKAVQTQRDLAGERRAVKALLKRCPTLAASPKEGDEWQCADPQQALTTLTELQACPAELLQCVWPEGERMRLKGRRTLAQLSLGLKQQGDWFVLSGQLALDDGRVLQLRELLSLASQHGGQFVPLGERDWLALGDSLRQRLSVLAQLSDVSGKGEGVRLNPLTAPLLAELADEVGEFSADSAWDTHLARLQSLRDLPIALPERFQGALRDYQLEGFRWLARLAHWGVGACLADDMGLGKTVQMLALCLYRAGEGPQLVVAPTSVAQNWLVEAARFAPSLTLRPYHQQRNLDNLGGNDLVITSYGLLQQDQAHFAAVPWRTVLLDEAQAIKNPATRRAQAAMSLQAEFRLAASGTPIENHLGELWSLFRFLNPGLLGSQERFNQRFATPIANGDSQARQALKTLVQPFILRRTKAQVLTELPPRTEILHKVALSSDEQHLYEALRQEALAKLGQDDEQQAIQVLAEITRLRRFCCHPSLVLPNSTLAGSKLAAFAEIVRELLDNGHKALVFSQFVDHLALARQWLTEQGVPFQYLDGATPAKTRQARVEAFQRGEGQVFLISLKAGGAGLNLTEADYVIHLDPWWNPAVEDQASDRVHRIGQQRPVTVYRLITANTIEEQIIALHHAKRDLADSLLEGGDISAKLDAEALLAVLRGEPLRNDRTR